MITLQFDEKSKNGKLLLDFTKKLKGEGQVIIKRHPKSEKKELNTKTKPFKPLTDKEVALGIGRKFTPEEWEEYLDRPQKNDKGISLEDFRKKMLKKTTSLSSKK